MSTHIQSRTQWLKKSFVAFAAVFFLLLVSACSSGGGTTTVHVYDNAGVLDKNRVQSEASSLPYSMDIYTVNTFQGTKPEFDNTTRAKLGSNPDLIVMAVDTVHHHLAIVRGSNVPLSSSQINGAVSSFVNNYNNGDYTGATIATIGSLRNSLGASVGPSGGGVFSGLLATLCIVGLVIVGAILLFGIFLRRRLGGGRYTRPPVYQQPYQQPPYNQGYPPNYSGPPGYYQGQGQGPGINPLAAGGLGAAAGGLLGYELGKEAGENQGQEQGQGQGDGGWAGASGDFGGGGSGDFGGGGSGDSGGGGSGDFGGGGGGDSGGGGSGNF